MVAAIGFPRLWYPIWGMRKSKRRLHVDHTSDCVFFALWAARGRRDSRYRILGN